MRRTFVAGIATAAFLLSFARLVVKVLESGAFDDLAQLLPAAVAGALVIAAACVWAFMVDCVWIAGLFGVRQNRGDWRAWVMLCAYAVLTVWIQAFGVPREVVWAIPPIALVLSLVILDLDKKPQEPEAATEPEPADDDRRVGLVDERDPERTMEMLPPGTTVRRGPRTANRGTSTSPPDGTSVRERVRALVAEREAPTRTPVLDVHEVAQQLHANTGTVRNVLRDARREHGIPTPRARPHESVPRPAQPSAHELNGTAPPAHQEA